MRAAILLLPVFALRLLMGQTPTTETVTFSAPSITSALTTCGLTPFEFTQTATYTFTTWGCGGVRLSSGTMSLQGTGYCSGFSGICLVSVLGPVSPHFIPEWTVNSTQTSFVIYEVAQNVSDGNLLQGYGCGITHNTQNAAQTRSRPTCPGGTSPIVFDTRDVGFHLTDAAHGTVLAGVQTSWTDPKFGNGWLVRANPDGSWTDMSLDRNFFGNLSPQPASAEPNGYRALAFLAAQQGCGAVDHLDARNCPSAWGTLRVWVDNGDGVVEPGEIHTLDQLGYTSISLRYHDSGYVDEYGNRFRYRSSVRDDQGKERERSFDVFLVTAPR